MKRLHRLIQKAKHSRLQRWLLNLLLNRFIPFNKPHGLRIVAVMDDGFTIMLPYRRRNLNHLQGIHACALAALSEYVAGISLSYCLYPDEHRLIMKNLSVEFHYQAKSNVTATVQLGKDWIADKIRKPLEANDSVLMEMPVQVFDAGQQHISTAVVQWQLKKWSKVRTKPD